MDELHACITCMHAMHARCHNTRARKLCMVGRSRCLREGITALRPLANARTGTGPPHLDCPTPSSRQKWARTTAEKHGNNHTPGYKRRPGRKAQRGHKKPNKQKPQNANPKPALGSKLRRMHQTQRRPWKTHGYASVPCSRKNGNRRKLTPMAW